MQWEVFKDLVPHRLLPPKILQLGTRTLKAPLCQQRALLPGTFKDLPLHRLLQPTT